ncbi:bifunctional dihydroflavonol 4-reductase/flavanone 4-reductase protein [Dioscorea alata]|uniref:Bifunctional dihydroflavonol 4-reductase/flavanone 4-reductase protein n=1 Tax=Dioscorea alata TaxID=55571 RepID=A0ACB7TTN7_DIOAL|nr:bifunctional dihydroflavonol 4-reductase/flavanone 4-reductase protein [Dioscorea alata]
MKGPVAVTGAAGYIGSWLVMRLLEKGYTVRATVRDPSDYRKTKPLLELPNAEKQLSLWKADLGEEGSFDEVIQGCTGVFHVATFMDFESLDPENEVIKPTVNAILSILKSCKKAGSVRRIVFTSSAGTVNVQEQQMPEYDESSWSDVDFCRRVKMTGWMYFVSKTLAEKAAWDFAKDHGLDLITVIPPLVVGPFVSSSMPPSMITALALITGNEAHYSILKQIQLVHLDDLCEGHIFLFEHPEAKGRYICSSHDATIFTLAKMIKERFPEYDIPQQFKGIDENIGIVHFSSKKIMDLGFKFKYTMEQMFVDGIQICREKKFIPLQTVKEIPSIKGKINGIDEQVSVATN